MGEANDPLTRQLKAWQPRTLIAVGDDAPHLLGEYLKLSSQCELERVATKGAAERLLSLESKRRYDFALVAGYLERVEAAEGSAVLARLRDVLARRLWLMVTITGDAKGKTPWSDAELSAFGFTLLNRLEENGKSARLFGFDIASYKRTPDWLNPRHWAHPELWEKFRW